jgi:hypothetical protein
VLVTEAGKVGVGGLCVFVGVGDGCVRVGGACVGVTVGMGLGVNDGRGLGTHVGTGKLGVGESGIDAGSAVKIWQDTKKLTRNGKMITLRMAFIFP